jgi:hypothetical protein
MSRVACYTCLAVSLVSLACGYLMGGLWLALPVLLALGILWLAALRRGWSWVPGLGLALIVAAAAAGLLLKLPTFLMTVGAVCGLLAWDLSDFNRRLGLAAEEDNVLTLEQRHLAWLGITVATGLLLSTTALLIKFQFSFALTLLLAILAALGIVRLVSWIGRRP